MPRRSMVISKQVHSVIRISCMALLLSFWGAFGAGGIIAGNLRDRDDTPPVSITDLEATLSTHDVILSWTPPVDDVGVTSYRIYQYESFETGGTEVAHILNGLIDSHLIPGVAGNPFVTFYYDVRAEDAAGNIADASNIVGEFDYDTRHVSTGPSIIVTPSTVGIPVLAGDSATDTVSVWNIGDEPLTISGIQGDETWLSGTFDSVPPLDIEPGSCEVLTIAVDAASLSPGIYNPTLSIGSNDSDDPAYPVEIDMTAFLLDMVPLPGGTFQMGSESDWAYTNEQPVHQVTIRAFLLSRYTVTNGKMREIMQWAYDSGLVNASTETVTNTEGDSQELLDLNDGDCQIDFSGGIFSVESGKENHPCIEVSWYGAMASCNYLSDMEGFDRCISFTDWSCDFNANGYRLPTEAECEYACRAGTTTDYYNGDETVGGCYFDPNLDQIGWYCGNDSGSTEAVGEKQPNDWVLYDMCGNVFDWCNDWFGDYSSEAQTDPTGPESGLIRAVRGGGWEFEAQNCRCANRGGNSASSSHNYIGFRPARR